MGFSVIFLPQNSSSGSVSVSAHPALPGTHASEALSVSLCLAVLSSTDSLAGSNGEFRLLETLEEASQGLHVITPFMRVDENVVPVEKNIVHISDHTIHSSF
ncbi:hypothetical protein RRG08_015503 [Elysia crispata]|uniref:Uncharacterized protein n=1 Tax=Elysia crispata TaxID=231223 RepID=A0AAE1AD38_9GAST|nr:hypothetical protein RRG08_015503 [Elysia crispata]